MQGSDCCFRLCLPAHQLDLHHIQEIEAIESGQGCSGCGSLFWDLIAQRGCALLDPDCVLGENSVGEVWVRSGSAPLESREGYQDLLPTCCLKPRLSNGFESLNPPNDGCP